MALNVSRWINYAKARLDGVVADGHRELDRLEAEREVELADKPWLRPASDTPNLDEVRARIEWEARQAREQAGEPTAPGGAPTQGASAPPAAGAATDPAISALDARRKEAADRLAAIRAELGVAPDDPPPA